MMSSIGKRARRWLKSTSNRTFVMWPLLLLALQAARDGGWPRVSLWGVPLLVWGYGQYKVIGIQRTARGGGGPGMSNPPVRLVTDGIYGYTRNPMYLGHMIFFLGLAITFSGAGLTLAGVAAWLLLLVHLPWFNARAREDEAQLTKLFGADYDAYRKRVKRWVPGVY
jgi:protein-S-isoprenylcysteine O-methyltransferase Ste14